MTLGDARRGNRHQAIVVITRCARPGLCPSNADSFLCPFGPPVLQVASQEAQFLADCARHGFQALLTAHVERASTKTFNVVAVASGTNKSLAPVIVMTPRSGWWRCASERGGGLACWLEIARVCETPILLGTFYLLLQAVMSLVTWALTVSLGAGRDWCQRRRRGFISAPILAQLRGQVTPCRHPTMRWNRCWPRSPPGPGSRLIDASHAAGCRAAKRKMSTVVVDDTSRSSETTISFTI